MAEGKHTPGPWFISRDERLGMEWNNHIACAEAPHIEICAMFHSNKRDGNATGEANAHLVAAAPEMLAALEAAEKHVESAWFQAGDDYDHGAGDALTALRAAVAKAKGDAS